MKITILTRRNWPVDLLHPEVKGIAVGGCGCFWRPIRKRHQAHAHLRGLHRGWICFHDQAALEVESTRLHELAHIVTREGHTKRWREYLLQIGGTLDAVPGISQSYHVKKRAKVVATDVRADGRVFVTYSNGAVTCYEAGSAFALRYIKGSP